MTGRTIELTAADGHRLSAYQSMPDGKPKGGIVVLQEIFGVTGNIRAVCDRLAGNGYRALAPALFDREARDLVLPYSNDGSVRGRASREAIGWTHALADTAAAAKELSSTGKVAVFGFCWGGTIAWMAAARLEQPIDAAVCYYPTQILPFAAESPRCPVLMHFGERDPFAPLSTIGTLRANHGSRVEIQVYPAGHGFDCNDRADYHRPSADRARERTLAFLAREIGCHE